MSKLLELAKSNAITYTALQKRKLELTTELNAIEEQSRKLHVSNLSIVAVLGLVEPELKSFLARNQYNHDQLIAELPAEIDSKFIVVKTVEEATANISNAGTINMKQEEIKTIKHKKVTK